MLEAFAHVGDFIIINAPEAHKREASGCVTLLAFSVYHLQIVLYVCLFFSSTIIFVCNVQSRMLVCYLTVMGTKKAQSRDFSFEYFFRDQVYEIRDHW